MKKLGVYLTFPGTCNDALNFYKDALSGTIVSKQTFGEAPGETEEKDKDRIMHSEFKSEGIEFMASDGMPGQPVNRGDMITLNIMLTDEKEQEKIFNNLADGGHIGMPLQDTFWGAKFGMVTDKFGINWMLNCEKPK
jgi:PhnB protein